MKARSSPTDLKVGRLLEELFRTSDFEEACSVVLASALDGTSYDRGVLVLRSGPDLRSVRWGREEHPELRRISLSEGAKNPLISALDSERPMVLADPSPLELPGFDPCIVVPFARAEDRASGAVLLPAEGGKPRVRRIAAVVRRCAPALARILELQQLRRRSSDAELDNRILGQLLDLLPDPVLLTNSANDYLLANQRAQKLFSTTEEDSEGRTRAVNMNTALFSAFLTQLVIGGEGDRSRELNLVNPTDGTDLLFEVLAKPLPAAGPEEDTYFIISVLRDITDLKRALVELEREYGRSRAAEHRARQESKRMNAIIENAGEPILVSDLESNIVLMNTEAERLFDLPSSDAAEDSRLRRQLWANVTRFTTLVSEFLLQPEARRVEMLTLTEPASGRDLPVHVMSTKIMDVREGTSAVVSVLRDLTQLVENERLARELRMLNEELEDRVRIATQKLEERNRLLEWQSKELKHASRLKSEFVANMSHELRTPINAILGYTSLLREAVYGRLSDPQELALSKIEAASEHLLALINDVLDLSKIEAGKTPIRMETVVLDDLIGEIGQTIDPMVREKGLDYQLEIDEELPPLQTDRTKLKQILLNLLDNAVKYTTEGSVTLRVARSGEDERIRFDVRDTGIGLESKDLEIIFEDFRQADQSPGRRFGGTGLGLSISRKLLHLLGGSMSVESVPGEGSCFTVEIPIRPSPRDPTGGESRDWPEARSVDRDSVTRQP